jgi:hypothetical protein
VVVYHAIAFLHWPCKLVLPKAKSQKKNAKWKTKQSKKYRALPEIFGTLRAVSTDCVMRGIAGGDLVFSVASLVVGLAYCTGLALPAQCSVKEEARQNNIHVAGTYLLLYDLHGSVS